MNPRLKMLLRTIQVNAPVLLDAKFAVMRRYRRVRRIPFDRDFDGLRLFPLQQGAVFLDVGANRGQSTDAIRLITPGSHVHLFEPNPLLCRKLRRQFAGVERVVIHDFGLGNVASEQVLHVPFYKRWMFDGLASFDPDMARRWLEGRIFFYSEKHLSVQKVTCKVRRLDDLGLAPFFVKLDVQGYEFLVILGGEQTIRTHEPVLLIESPPGENVIALLGQFGYAFYTFRGGKFIRGCADGNNTYFMTEQRAAVVRSHILA